MKKRAKQLIRRQVSASNAARKIEFSPLEQRVSTNVPSPVGLVAVPLPPAGAKWRIEQELPDHGWQFYAYADGEAARTEKLGSIRAFGGRGRAIELPFGSGGRPRGESDGFIGDNETGAGKPGGRSSPARRGGGAAAGQRGSIVGPANVSRLAHLRAAASHWLSSAQQAGCDVDLPEGALEQIVEAAKRALRRKPQKFEQALNRAPRPRA